MANAESSRPWPVRATARVARFLRKRLLKWAERHQHPFNRAMHIIGIPMTLVGIYCWCVSAWLWGTGLFIGGYLLQYVGHRVEGNDVGEWAFLKWLLGWPRVLVSPRWQSPRPPE